MTLRQVSRILPCATILRPWGISSIGNPKKYPTQLRCAKLAPIFMSMLSSQPYESPSLRLSNLLGACGTITRENLHNPYRAIDRWLSTIMFPNWKIVHALLRHCVSTNVSQHVNNQPPKQFKSRLKVHISTKSSPHGK